MKSPYDAAMTWTSYVTTMCLIMLIPMGIGLWIDKQLGIVGFVILGLLIVMTSGMWYLMTRLKEKNVSAGIELTQFWVGKIDQTPGGLPGLIMITDVGEDDKYSP